jgi:hypothetical protein
MNRSRAVSRLVVVLSVLALLLSAVPAHAGTGLTISGRVWDDEDLDGIQDRSEDGLAVQVFLHDASNQEVAWTFSTLPDGAYSFDIPDPGDYTVRITFTSNMRATRRDHPTIGDRWDSDIDDLGVIGPLTVSTESLTHQDAGIALTDVRGRFYLDRDGDDDWSEADTPLAGLDLKLTVGDSPTTASSVATTDEDGEYRLLVPPGVGSRFMSIRTTLPAGHETSLRSRYRLSPKGRSSPIYVQQVSNPGQVHNIADFTIIHPVRIGDRVWLDKNLNGRQDKGEPGIARIWVRLMDPELEYTYWATFTSNNGSFQLTAPVPGKYRLVASLPASGGTWSPMRTDLPEGVDSDVRRTGPDPGTSPILTLKAGKNRIDLDIGMKPKR